MKEENIYLLRYLSIILVSAFIIFSSLEFVKNNITNNIIFDSLMILGFLVSAITIIWIMNKLLTVVYNFSINKILLILLICLTLFSNVHANEPIYQFLNSNNLTGGLDQRDSNDPVYYINTTFVNNQTIQVVRFDQNDSDNDSITNGLTGESLFKSLTDKNEYTFSLWVKSDDIDDNSIYLEHWNSSGTTKEGSGVRYGSSFGGEQLILPSLNLGQSGSYSDKPYTEWNLITISRNQSHVDVYMNGEFLFDYTNSAIPSINFTFSNFGFSTLNYVGARDFEGEMYDYRLYDEVLNNDSIYELYQQYLEPINITTNFDEINTNILDLSEYLNISGIDLSSSNNLDLTNVKAYYKLDDLFDSSNNGHNLSVNGGVTQNNTDCLLGSCYQFNGGSDYLSTISNPYDINTNDVSVSIWFKADDITPSGTQALFVNKYVYSSANNKFGLFLNTFQTIQGNIRDTTQSNFNGVNLVQEGWNHAVYTREGTTCKLYLNGVADTVNNACRGGDISSNTNWILGNTNAPHPYEGLLDEMIIYDTVLNSTQVSDLYNLEYIQQNEINITYNGDSYTLDDEITFTSWGNQTINVYGCDTSGNCINKTFTLLVNPQYEISFVDSSSNIVENFDINLYYPDSTDLEFTNNVEEVNISTVYLGDLYTGNYTVTFNKLGYIFKNYSFIVEENETNFTRQFTVENATINLKIYDLVSGELITTHPHLEIQLIPTTFTSEVPDGEINISDIAFINQEYQIIATDDHFFTETIFFNYDGQSYLEQRIYMLETGDANAGVLIVEVEDSSSKIENQLVNLLAWNSNESAFITVGQSKTNSNGQAYFNVELDNTLYKATSTLNGQTKTTAEQTIKVTGETILITFNDVFESYPTEDDITYLLTNSSYNSTHQLVTFTFEDNNNIVQNFCLEARKSIISSSAIINEQCVTTNSGEISFYVNINQSYKIIVQAIAYKEEGQIILDSIIYKSSMNLEDSLGNLVIFFVLASFVISIALGVTLQNVPLIGILTIINSWLMYSVFSSTLSYTVPLLITVIMIAMLYATFKKRF